MKRIVALLLIAASLLCICGCKAKTENNNTKNADQYAGTFHVGYARRDLTPTQSVPLAGYSNGRFRYSETFLDPVCSTAVAFTDEEENTVIVLAMDTVKVNDQMVSEVRAAVSEKLGIPENHISLSASHTHSAVDYSNSSDLYLTNTYVPWMTEQLVQTCVDAFEDRLPAAMYAGSIEAEGLNFVRHYSYVNAEGEKVYFGDLHGKAVYNSTTTHTTQSDPTMHILQIKREGGKDIVLVNWRGHPHFTDGATVTNLSADYIGAFRDDMEMSLDCNFIYFQGASGNINTTSRIQSECKTKELHAFSALLTEYATACLKNNMKPLNGTKIQTRQTMYNAPFSTKGIEYAEVAAKCRSIFDTTGDTAAAMAVVGDLPINSVYHAGAIASRPKTEGKSDSIELDVFSIGDDLAFCINPHEIFDTNSVWLEENSPYSVTLLLGYSNQNKVYAPSQAAIDYGCYEADITRWEDGTAEKEMQEYVNMMQDTKK